MHKPKTYNKAVNAKTKDRLSWDISWKLFKKVNKICALFCQVSNEM